MKQSPLVNRRFANVKLFYSQIEIAYSTTDVDDVAVLAFHLIKVFSL